METVSEDQKLNTPIEKAKEFAKAIVESDEYKRFMLCNEAYQNDLESRRLLAQYQSYQRRLKLGRFEPGIMDKLKELQIKVSQNEIITNFNKSGNDLTALLVSTDNLISNKIGRRFAFNQGGSCCG